MTPRQRVVAALSVTQIVHWGSLYYAFSVLMPAMEAELGAERVTMTAAFSASLLAQAAVAALAGRAFDRIGTRRCMTGGSLLAGAALFGAALVPGMPALFAAWILCGIAAAFTQYEAAFAAVTASWGADSRRGITILTFAGGLASTVFWPLTAALSEPLGWRGALLVIAALNAACAGLHWAFLPGPVPRATTAGASLGEALRRPVFWFFAAALTLNGFAFAGVAAHVVPALLEKGLGATALTLAAFIGVMQTAGRLLDFLAGGRVGLRTVGLAAFAAQPVAFLLLAWATEIPWLVLCVVLYGMSNGLLTIVRGALPAELFGRAAYGAIVGALVTPAALARAVGPVTIGWGWSLAGSYPWPLTVTAGISALALVCFVLTVRRA